MSVQQDYLAKTKAEISQLESTGVVLCGNAFSPILFLKGEVEESGVALLAGADGVALKAALAALGYPPEAWAGISANKKDGSQISPEELRLAIATLDPSTLVALDNTAAAVLREAFTEELVAIPDIAQAALQPGVVSHVLGMRVLVLDGFAASLSSQKEKQRMWLWLRQLPPPGEPY